MSPIAYYLQEQNAVIWGVRIAIGMRASDHLTRYFNCYAKAPFSRNQARKLKRSHNDLEIAVAIRHNRQPAHCTLRRNRVASIYRCSLCLAWHIHSTIQPLELGAELREWLNGSTLALRTGERPVEPPNPA
jgi:hypothetical protein